eukprot:TRINITY_DN4224_c0_g1_i8.p1 TRINITY_DN4224_c0_g1~~TRINITY_DN4224_c0_g1_i8.p1  ORF type:complete len:264 (-),score=61.97 TRINITY_DN4224_c0_g1_i8:649-1440(-)
MGRNRRLGWKRSRDYKSFSWRSVKYSVLAIQFAPKHLGLKLAACSKDGFVRIYEAVDIAKLSHWHIVDQFQSCAPELPRKSINSVCWNPNPFDSPMLVVAGDDSSIKIWEYDSRNKKWQQPCKLEGHTETVHHVSWAPNLGRSYHMLASGSKDTMVKIWHLVIKKEIDGSGTMEGREVGSFSDHQSSVWCVEWNGTGTMLASSGDDGCVRFWKLNWKNEWACLLEVSADLDDTEQQTRQFRFTGSKISPLPSPQLDSYPSTAQ